MTSSPVRRACAAALLALCALYAVLPPARGQERFVAHGSEIGLLGTGGPDRVATMMGVALPGPTVLGPLVWVLAAARLAADRELRLLTLFYVTLPFTGFFVGRDYWGFLVVPFTLLW